MTVQRADQPWPDGEIPPISGIEYRETMRHVAGAVAVLACSQNGHRHGITATAICSVSADPAQLMICINAGSSLIGPVTGSGGLTVNFLGVGQREIAETFSRPVKNAETRFRAGVWSALASGMPILEDAVAVLDCRVLDVTTLATHQAILVRVVEARTAPSTPLLYFAGNYHGLSAPVERKAA